MKIAFVTMTVLAALCIHCGGGNPPQDPSSADPSATPSPSASASSTTDADAAAPTPEAPKK